MADLSEAAQIASLVASMAALQREVSGLREDLKGQHESFVSKGELVAWKTGMDKAAESLEAAHARDIGELKADLARETAKLKADLATETADRKAQRIPPGVYVTGVVGVSSLAISIIIWLAERT